MCYLLVNSVTSPFITNNIENDVLEALMNEERKMRFRELLGVLANMEKYKEKDKGTLKVLLVRVLHRYTKENIIEREKIKGKKEVYYHIINEEKALGIVGFRRKLENLFKQLRRDRYESLGSFEKTLKMVAVSNFYIFVSLTSLLCKDLEENDLDAFDYHRVQGSKLLRDWWHPYTEAIYKYRDGAATFYNDNIRNKPKRDYFMQILKGIEEQIKRSKILE
jgi:hypothetical protein